MSEIKRYYLTPYGPIQNTSYIKALQLHVQPDVRFIIKACLSGQTLETYAASVEPHVITLLLENPERYKLNVIQVDWFTANILRAVVFRNLVNASDQTGNGCLMAAFRGLFC